ncbi:MAG TPA: D-amino acid aminotransferase [Verrucomicrobiae bacterium]|nr:D-amino acid aminotransferase [Verrucomicrobiae bacterium]
MSEIAYVNGEFLPLERATVHVEDRGFQFADGVYEVVRTYHGKPFAMDEHLARLARSLDALELKNPLPTEKWKSIIGEGIKRSGFAEAIVYLQVTRGCAKRHRSMPEGIEPTVVLTVRQLPPPPTKIRETGIAVITLPEFRWARCDIKSIALLPSVLAYRTAQKAGASDAIFFGEDDTVYESSAANVFIVTNGRLRTPPKNTRILPGVTRDKLLEVARAAKIEVVEERITKSELLSAQEVFLSSTTAEVTPVATIDGKQIGTGKPGPVSARLFDQFAQMFIRI